MMDKLQKGKVTIRIEMPAATLIRAKIKTETQIKNQVTNLITKTVAVAEEKAEVKEKTLPL